MFQHSGSLPAVLSGWVALPAIRRDEVGDGVVGDVGVRLAALSNPPSRRVDAVRLAEARRAAEGVLRDNLSAFERELMAPARNAAVREQRALQELEAVRDERRRLSRVWNRVERARGIRFTEDPGDNQCFLFNEDGRPRQRGAVEEATDDE
jgi:hypothetical protein